MNKIDRLILKIERTLLPQREQSSKKKAKIAEDLNDILAMALYEVDTSRKSADVQFAKACLRLTKRTIKAEGLYTYSVIIGLMC
jgi:hypothetical protein